MGSNLEMKAFPPNADQSMLFQDLFYRSVMRRPLIITNNYGRPNPPKDLDKLLETVELCIQPKQCQNKWSNWSSDSTKLCTEFRKHTLIIFKECRRPLCLIHACCILRQFWSNKFWIECSQMNLSLFLFESVLNAPPPSPPHSLHSKRRRNCR